MPTTPETLEIWAERFVASRIDVTEKTKSLYRNAIARFGDLAAKDPSQIEPADIQTWIAAQADLAPRSLEHYFSTLRQVLNFVGVEPNPGGSPRVHLPMERRRTRCRRRVLSGRRSNSS
jgi:hypothetical protein